MVLVTEANIHIDIFLKITSDSFKDAFEIVQEHINVINKNPDSYTWWGNNQHFSPKKLNEFKQHGHLPKALIVIPRTSGGSGNIEYVADILDSIRFEDKGFPSDNWRPKYYSHIPHKVFLKLTNFKKLNNKTIYDVNNYFLLSNDEPLAIKLSTQYACGYVYRFESRNESLLLDGQSMIQKGKVFYEGDRKFSQHMEIERDHSLIKEAKRRFQRRYGRLFCEVCGFDFVKMYGSLGEGFIEGHHKIPLSHLKVKTESKVEDITLLCSNCHSMIHRKKDCLTVEELKGLIKKSKNGSNLVHNAGV
ncbi:HNH endonuclease [Priestia aryabhattai]|uniref:HNH endonuclease n=1 Tax=Priestia aryabhattai TaxID=412384 RepID=UPI003D2AA3D9